MSEVWAKEGIKIRLGIPFFDLRALVPLDELISQEKNLQPRGAEKLAEDMRKNMLLLAETDHIVGYTVFEMQGNGCALLRTGVLKNFRRKEIELAVILLQMKFSKKRFLTVFAVEQSGVPESIVKEIADALNFSFIAPFASNVRVLQVPSEVSNREMLSRIESFLNRKGWRKIS